MSILTTTELTTPRHTYAIPGVAPRDVPDELRGLFTHVVRATSDTTAGGLTAHYDHFVVVGTLHTFRGRDRVRPLDRYSRVFTPHPDGPSPSAPMAMEVRTNGGAKIVHLEPVTFDTDQGAYVRAHAWTMAGGNYAVGDSRLTDLASQLTGHRFYGAVAVHDRVES